MVWEAVVKDLFVVKRTGAVIASLNTKGFP